MRPAITAASRGPSLYVPHHYLVYELRPGYRSADGRTAHNSYGLRGPEFAVAKDPAVRRIVCMGESTTYCTTVRDDARTYPARLEAVIRETHPGTSVEVLNAGIPGYTSAENLLHFIFKVQPLEPDLVIFYFTHNDVHPRRWPTLSRDYREYRQSWGRPSYGRSWLRDRIVQLLRPDRTLGAKVLRLREYRNRIAYENLERNPPGHFRDNMRSLAILADGWGVDLLVVMPPYPGLEGTGPDMVASSLAARGVLEHRRVVEELAREMRFDLYDLRADMPPPPRGTVEDDPYYADEVHVTERGADLMARCIAAALDRTGVLSRPRREAVKK